jgi:hypothetical protein
MKARELLPRREIREIPRMSGLDKRRKPGDSFRDFPGVPGGTGAAGEALRMTAAGPRSAVIAAGFAIGCEGRPGRR